MNNKGHKHVPADVPNLDSSRL